MKIDVRPWGGRDTNYCLIIESGGNRLEEDYLTQEEVDNLSVEFLNDTLLSKLNRYEIIDKLIEVGLLDKEVINDWLKGENDE